MSNHPPIWNTLIEKLEAIRPSAHSPERSEHIYRQAVNDCIAIVRQHEAAQGDMVERVAREMRKVDSGLQYPQSMINAQAAIAAMGDARSSDQTTVAPASASPCEIRVLTDEKLYDLIDTAGGQTCDVNRVMKALRPYLHPAPVNQKLVEALHDADLFKLMWETYFDAFKTYIATMGEAPPADESVYETCMHPVFVAIRPYLASLPETKPVSLEKCVEALHDAMEPADSTTHDYAKAVLDSANEQGAGVKYGN